ncbi:MAG: hypothetical protein A3E88_05375 [Legionellales bacterium RIFCSPHIGHO2_12_FULL_35_11]|nr:MAG: hypothetical protein A3E88_05375 [Legionellales bacterium RIFCSPHIGHO2_12_FULL_35_11]
MLVKFIFIFLLFLASIYVGVYLAHDSGYVLISYDNWTIESTLFITIILILLVIFVLYLATTIISKIIFLPNAWKKWRLNSQSRKSQLKTRQGFIEFNEGHWKQAEKYLIDALPNADTPLLNYLTAARAAQEIGDNKLRDDYLREAQQSMPEAKIAVELTQAQLQIANNQLEQGLATLKHLQDLSPKHPYVLKLLMQLYEKINDWTQLIEILPTLKKEQIIPKEQFLQKEQLYYAEALSSLIKQSKNSEIEKLFQIMPREIQRNSAITYIYVRHLMDNKQLQKAEQILRKNLTKIINANIKKSELDLDLQNSSDGKLFELYSQLSTEYIQIKFLENLLKPNPNSADINLCLGKCSIKLGLWGKALEYLEKSIHLMPSSEAYKQLGILNENQNNILEAIKYYKKSLGNSQ